MAYYDIPEHPDIANALRTGYPWGEKHLPCCEECGQEADPDSNTYRWLFQWGEKQICYDCLMEELKELPALELAGRLDLESINAGEEYL